MVEGGDNSKSFYLISSTRIKLTPQFKDSVGAITTADYLDFQFHIWGLVTCKLSGVKNLVALLLSELWPGLY